MKELKIPVLGHVRLIVQPRYDGTEDVRVQVYDANSLVVQSEGTKAMAVGAALEEINKRYHVFSFDEERGFLEADALADTLGQNGV